MGEGGVIFRKWMKGTEFHGKIDKGSGISMEKWVKGAEYSWNRSACTYLSQDFKSVLKVVPILKLGVKRLNSGLANLKYVTKSPPPTIPNLLRSTVQQLSPINLQCCGSGKIRIILRIQT